MAKSLDDHITITPGVLGGKPRVAGHRIAVIHVSTWHIKMNMSVEEIARDYNLSLADVHAALAYYYDHQEEIDQQRKEDEEFVEAMRKEVPSKLNQTLRNKSNEANSNGELNSM